MLAEVHEVQELERRQRRSESSAGIQSRMVEDVLVVRPQGGLDVEVVAELTRIVEDAALPVLIDLNDCIVVDPHVLRSSDTRHERTMHDICVVCRRLSARRLLARTPALEHVAIFRSVEDALQAPSCAVSATGEGGREPDRLARRTIG